MVFKQRPYRPVRQTLGHAIVLKVSAVKAAQPPRSAEPERAVSRAQCAPRLVIGKPLCSRVIGKVSAVKAAHAASGHYPEISSPVLEDCPYGRFYQALFHAVGSVVDTVIAADSTVHAEPYVAFSILKNA